MLAFFHPAPDAAALDDARAIDRLYRRWRWSVFLSIVIGYTIFYVTRLATSVARDPMVASGALSIYEVGAIDSVFLVTYAIGKTTNGFLADRASPRRLFATALLVSALANLAFGISSTFAVFIVAWLINGWVQSCGVPVSGVVMASWFSPRELGTRYSIWSMAHHLGEGLTFLVSAKLVGVVTHAGAGPRAWRAAFLGPAALGAVSSFILYRTLADRPQTKGLPAVASHRRESTARTGDDRSTLRSLQLEVLRNPYIWICGVASALVYVARYAINNWGVFYLQKACNYSIEDAGAALSIFPLVGIAGTLLAGPLSDRVTGGRRVPVALVYAMLLAGSLALLYRAGPGDGAQIAITLATAGFAMGGLLAFLGGLIAMELCSPRAAGAALGIVGGFSYLGAGLQSVVSSGLIERGRHGDAFDFSAARLLWVGAPALAILLVALLWRAERRPAA